jgi:N-acetylglucosamine kinase-like BadF-type ATPase
MSAAMIPLPANPRHGLGLDAGGTQTRWAVADGCGTLVAEGSTAPLSGLQLGDAPGRAALAAVLRALAGTAPPVQGVVAGLTGLDPGQQAGLRALAAAAFGVAADAVQAMSDIELLCHAAFAPGQGCVLYAGTGSIAAALDAGGGLHRAGGRGPLIDDAGGGHWIAREALRWIWRAEDEAPGSTAGSALGQAVGSVIGGTDWARTRAWVHGASRGEVGTLALAVAAAAEQDPAALAILQAAGRELARLAAALQRRVGEGPLALAGRVFDLHPAIEASLRAALHPGLRVQRLAQAAHHAAARMAAGVPITPSPRTPA